MNSNELEITWLAKPVRGDLIFKPKMATNLDLSFLRKFQEGGKIKVDILGFSDAPNGGGKLLHFSPLKQPSIKRCVLSEFIESPALKELLSL